MKLLWLIFLSFFTLFGYDKLQIDDALTATDIAIERGYAIIRGSGDTQFFAYKKFQKPVSVYEEDSFSYVKKIQKNDPYTLIVQRHKNHAQSHERVLLPFFDGTQDVYAHPLFDQTFIAARNLSGHLYTALLHPHNALSNEHVFTQFEIKKIHKIFTHINGDFTIVATQNNRPNKLEHYNRGSGDENLFLIRLSSALNIQSTRQLGGTTPLRFIDAALETNQKLTILTQQTPERFTLLVYSPYEETTQTDYNLTQPLHLSTMALSESEMLWGTRNNCWLRLDRATMTTQTVLLQEIENATVTQLSWLPDSSIVVSGMHDTIQGDSDLFIQRYAPRGTLLWDKRFTTPYNEAALTHERVYHGLYLFGSNVNALLEPQLLSFSLDVSGKHLKSTPLLSAKKRFHARLAEQLKEHNITIASINTQGDIDFDFVYATGSDVIDANTTARLDAFANVFLATLQDPRWFGLIDQIYINGLSSSEWNFQARDAAYLNNATLGHKRAMALLKILLKNADDKAKETILLKNMSTNSFSSNQAYKNSQGLENFTQSRRNTIHIAWNEALQK